MQFDFFNMCFILLLPQSLNLALVVMLYCDLQGGMYVFQLFDYYACNGACVLFLSVFETLTMGWIFGESQTGNKQ